MKKLLLLAASLLAIQSFAQRIGVKAGLVMTSYRAAGRSNPTLGFSRSNITTSFKNGLIVGGYADVDLHPNIMFRSGLELVLKGGKEQGTYQSRRETYVYQSRFNFTAFDIPLNLLYRPANGSSHFFVGGGPVPGLLIEGGLNKFDLGVNVLAGYQLANGLNASLSYNHGILNVAQSSFDYESLRNQHAGFTLGYSFRRRTTTERVERAKKVEEANTQATAAKAVYAEVGGPGGLLSFNYDARLTKSLKGFGFRAGAGLLFDFYSFGFTVPVAANYLIGNRAHFFELAAGASFFSFREENQDSWFSFPQSDFVAPFAWAGYRYQPPDKKFVFRAGINQFFKDPMPGILQAPVPSLSFGYSIR